MLTIQPKVAQYPQRNISFRNSDVYDEDFYKEKTKYYENQTKEFDELIGDQKTPNSFKKVLKGFKVVSEGLLEGWAVAWGASKGAKVIKSAFVKGASSKAAKNAQEIVGPAIEGAKKTGGKLLGVIGEWFEKIKASKFIQNISEQFSKLTEKLNNNKYGKYVVQGFEYVGKFFKWIGSAISKGYNKVATALKSAKGEEVYDKATNVVSKTLGVGAGAAGAYNAATNADKRAEATDKIDNPMDEDPEFPEFIGDEE